MTFTFKLEREDGTLAEPPILKTAVPNWKAGDTIPLGAERATLEVIQTRFDLADQELVLVVREADV
jgi:hypothetical protein